MLLSYLTDRIVSFLCLSDISKKKKINDNILVDYFYKFKRAYGVYSSFTPYMQKKYQMMYCCYLRELILIQTLTLYIF